MSKYNNFRTFQESKFEEHTKAVHLVQKDMQCPHCDFKTAWKRSIDDHIKIVHRKGVQDDLKCELCDFRTHRKGSLRSHLLTHTDRNTEDINCEHCGKHFTRKDSYQNHLTKKHGNQTFSCEECDFTSKYKQAIKAHRLWKHTENNKNFQCDLCQKAYVTKKDLKCHTNHLRETLRLASLQN